MRDGKYIAGKYQKSFSPALSILIFLSLFSIDAFSQMPGSWQRIKVSDHATPLAFAFADSLNGLLMAHPNTSSSAISGEIFRTSDGGEHWKLVCDTGVSSVSVFEPEPFHYPQVGHAYYFNASSCYITHDTGNIWTYAFYDQNLRYDESAIFYSPGTSFRTTTGDFTNKSINVEVSRDSSITYDFNTVYSAKSWLFSYYFKDAIFLDSLTILASMGLANYQPIYFKSTDGGNSWTEFFITNKENYLLDGSQHFVKGLNGTSLYIVGPQGNQHPEVDFFYSTDIGNTWNLDSTHKGTIYRLANPANTELWGFVGKHIYEYAKDLVALVENKGKPFADTLAYSPDNGKTWYHDTHTFIGDTMVQMLWLSGTNGFIMTYRDSATFIYKFHQTSGVKEPQPAIGSDIMDLIPDVLHTNSVRISLAHKEHAEVILYDIMGRTIMTVGEGSFDQGEHFLPLKTSALSPGTYTIRLATPSSIVTRKLLIVK